MVAVLVIVSGGIWADKPLRGVTWFYADFQDATIKEIGGSDCAACGEPMHREPGDFSSR